MLDRAKDARNSQVKLNLKKCIEFDAEHRR